ncbi:MAG: hypothetical protein KGI98_17490, partial [Euryarchaeota archaeon]|nr:hypothetical protein [Euryarchaeota archaeon]
AGIGAPVTPKNIVNVGMWLAQEQHLSSWAQDATNPLGVEQGGAVHPQADVYSGIVLTANTLLGSLYAPIVSTLRNQAPPTMFAQAVINSPWSGTTYRSRGLMYFLTQGSLTSTNPGYWSHVGTAFKQAVGVPFGPVGGAVTKGVGAVGGAVHDITSVGGLIGKITSGQFLKNLGIFVAGLGLVVAGGMIFLSDTKAAHEARAVAPEVVAA